MYHGGGFSNWEIQVRKIAGHLADFVDFGASAQDYHSRPIWLRAKSPKCKRQTNENAVNGVEGGVPEEGDWVAFEWN